MAKYHGSAVTATGIAAAELVFGMASAMILAVGMVA